MLFGGISGSAVADTSALGSILMPVMKEKGYDGDYAVNVTVTSSVAGVVIPPSHNMILFSVAAGGVSVSSLFIAGIVPGVLMCLCLAVAAYIVAVRRGYGAEPFPGLRALALSFLIAIPGLLTAVIIVGGVLSGIMTVTESGRVRGDLRARRDDVRLPRADLAGVQGRRPRRGAHHQPGDGPGRRRPRRLPTFLRSTGCRNCWPGR